MFQYLKRFIGILKQKSNCAIPLDTPEEKDAFEENTSSFVDVDLQNPRQDCEMPIKERCEFVLKGCCLGDYAGQPYEANSLVECKDLEMEDLYKKSRDCTDDTILTCATAKVLWDSLNFGTERHFDKAYREYAKEYACPLGGYGARFLAWIYTDVNPNSCGNGSAMRVGPCGCLDKIEDVVKMAHESAICTHSHPEGIKGAVVTATCIWMAFHGYDKKDIGKYVGEIYSDSPYSPNVKWDIMKHYATVQGNPAVCQTTVPMAVSCFVNSESYEDCILKAIQFGWDTDTQAAIAGSIAGAYYQNFSDKSSEKWERLKKNKYIKEIVDI